VTTLRVFRLHLSILLPCEWWGRPFLNHSNIEAVSNKRQPGDSPRTTKQQTTKQLKAVLLFLVITLIHTCMLVHIIENFEIILCLLFDIQPLVMYKGGRPQNFTWEHFYMLQLKIRNMQKVWSSAS